MRYIPIILLCLCSSIAAQERWAGIDTIWSDGGDPLVGPMDPCFTPDSNIILFSNAGRIMTLDLRNPVDPQPLLPESLTVGGNELTPFMTYDGQSLYFSSDMPGGYGGLDIWVTRRTDDIWQMPVNLGPDLNTPADEMGPSLTADGAELYYCVTSGGQGYPGAYFGLLMKSNLINGQWTMGEIMPSPINSSGGERDPSISPDGNSLYFVSRRPMDSRDNSAWIGQRSGETWPWPDLLDGFINIIWQVCPYMPEGDPFSVAIDSAITRLLYTKREVYECIDPEVNMYMSHKVTGINDKNAAAPREISLSLYPNPFNSSLMINLSGASAENIAIYDILGQRIRSFHDINDNAIIWDGRSDNGSPCASGIYFVKASSTNQTLIRMVTMVK